MRPMVSVCFAALVALAGSATGARAGAKCDEALAAVLAARPDQTPPACAEAPFGVVLAADPGRAQTLALLATGGEARFKRHFGQDPGRYAIMDYDTAAGIQGWGAALRSAGFDRTLPNLSQTAFGRAITESVRRSVEANPQAAMMSAEMKEAAVATAMVSQQAKLTPFGMAATEATSVPHEIGHIWFIQAYWPQSGADAAGHYGGPGPDWLDETAAILMESGDSAEMRRSQFQAAYHGRGVGALVGYPVGKLVDLEAFLTESHPLQAQNALSSSIAQPIRVYSAEEARQSLSGVVDALVFYLKGRMFADFLVDRTGDPAIFGSIAAAAGSGRTFDDWLALEGKQRGLSADKASLQQDWRKWLEDRFGPVVSS